MDVDRFLMDKLKPRCEFVPVPELEKYFEDEIDTALGEFWSRESRDPTSDETRQIKAGVVGFGIRGLTGTEFGNAKKQAAQRKNFLAIAEGILSGVSASVTDALKKLYADDGDLSETDAFNIFICIAGITSPEMQPDQRLEIVRKLHREFAIDFAHIANRIIHLTGMGHEPGKPSASTEKTG